MSELTTTQQQWLNADTPRSGGSNATNAAKQRQNNFVDDAHYRLCSIYVEHDDNHARFAISKQYQMWSVFLTEDAKDMTFTLKDLKRTYRRDHGSTFYCCCWNPSAHKNMSVCCTTIERNIHPLFLCFVVVFMIRWWRRICFDFEKGTVRIETVADSTH